MFTLSEEQTLLRDAARGFVADKMPISHLRRLRDSANGDGFDRSLWAEIAAMGWTGVIVPEEYGGVALGYGGLGLILEQMGATLAPSPLLSTALIAPAGLMLSGDAAAQSHFLPAIVSGEAIWALAVDERAHHHGDGFAARIDAGKVTGAKRFVADGHIADFLLVATGQGLAIIDAKADRVAITRLTTVDSRGGADIVFDAAPTLAVLQGPRLIEQVLDRARIGLAAEMLGQAEAAFAQTAEYLKTRTQFGQLIGSFQGLQHRAAKMLVELELTRSCVLAALAALDGLDTDDKVAEAASLAKARAGDTLHAVTNEMVQMHGGIGMTDAHDSGLYLKRARVAEALYGSPGYHRNRFASLNGF
jgi:alkylation response protein AidB-like acyl-CoA dehydrogenase